ncbi:MAG: RodZ domain-containing protein [Syntrophorhabdus sp.]
MAVDYNKIGSILKTAREVKKIDLREVSDVLCLRKSLVEAIEAGNLKMLPHEVYVRSYIKRYAAFLNLSDQILPELIEEKEEDTPEKMCESKPQQKFAIKLPKFSFLHLPRKAFVYPAIALILVGFYVIDRMNRDYVPETVSKIETTVGFSSQSQVNPDSSITAEQQTVPSINEGKKLMITCKERAWISVVIDDNEKKEFMLNAQEMIILHAKERFDLLIGNAGGVTLILNGKDIDFTGKSGEVKRIKLS